MTFPADFIPVSHITQVPGWESPKEQTLLFQYAAEVEPEGLIVELGAEFGMSASLFAVGAESSVRIISIDLFPDDLLKTHRENLERVGLDGRTEQLVGDSHELWKTWAQPPIDLLFIDADHSFEGVRKDVIGWTPLVKPGGFVLFHDVAQPENTNMHPLHFEVARAVREFQTVTTDFVFIEAVDSIRVYQRKGGGERVADDR